MPLPTTIARPVSAPHEASPDLDRTEVHEVLQASGVGDNAATVFDLISRNPP